MHANPELETSAQFNTTCQPGSGTSAGLIASETAQHEPALLVVTNINQLWCMGT